MNTHDKIKKLIEFMPQFRSNLEKIPISDVELSRYNPRKKFGQEEEDELLESINSKGLLQPIIVYPKKGISNKYVLLDGQRRLMACSKLGLSKISAHILNKEPTVLEGMSIMFHIHNVHEDWTEMAIIDTLDKIFVELNLNSKKLSKSDLADIQKLTSLSTYKIKKYADILRYSKPILDKFKEDELKDKPQLDVDLLSELRTPIKKLKKVMPSLSSEYPEDKIVSVFIRKKADKIITTNKEIRKISKILTNASANKINMEVAREKIKDFLKNPEVSIQQIYGATSEAIEEASMVIKTSTRLREQIEHIDLRKLPSNLKAEFFAELEKLKSTISKKS